MTKLLPPKPLFLLGLIILMVGTGLSAWRMSESQQQMKGLTSATLPIQTLLRKIGAAAWHEDARKMKAQARSAESSADVPPAAMTEKDPVQSNIESLFEELSAFGHGQAIQHLNWPGAGLELGKLLGSLQSVLDQYTDQQRYMRLQLAFSGLRGSQRSLSSDSAANKTAAALSAANQSHAESVLSKQLMQSQQQLVAIANTANTHMQSRASQGRTLLLGCAVLVVLIALALLLQRRGGLAITLIIIAAIALLLVNRHQQKSIEQASWIAQPIIATTTEASAAWMETQRLMQRFTQLVLMHRSRADKDAISAVYKSFSMLGNATQDRIVNAQALLEQPFLEKPTAENDAADTDIRPKPNYPDELLELSKSLQRVSNSFTKMRGTVNLVLVQQSSRKNASRGRELARNLANEHQGFLATVVELERQASQTIQTIQQRLRTQQYWLWGVLTVLFVLFLIVLFMPTRRQEAQS